MAFILLPVKLSFADTLRHRHPMSPFRYRDEPPYIYAEDEDESSSRSALYIAIGAAAGFAAGVLMAERFGGFKGLTDRIKDTLGAGGGGEEEEEFDYEGLDEDEFDPDFDDDLTPSIVVAHGTEDGRKVLEAFRTILSSASARSTSRSRRRNHRADRPGSIPTMNRTRRSVSRACAGRREP